MLDFASHSTKISDWLFQQSKCCVLGFVIQQLLFQKKSQKDNGWIIPVSFVLSFKLNGCYNILGLDALWVRVIVLSDTSVYVRGLLIMDKTVWTTFCNGTRQLLTRYGNVQPIIGLLCSRYSKNLQTYTETKQLLCYSCLRADSW